MINIIVLDDELEANTDTIDLWKSDLESIDSSYSLEIFNSPKETLTRIQSLGNNTIIILDIQMPEMNGAKFLEIMRDENITVPVIGYTGNPNDNLLIDLLKNDLFSYVRKGQAESLNELIKYINKAIEKFKDNIPLELTEALNEYLERHPDSKNIEVSIKETGTTLTLENIEDEISKGTNFGKNYEKALYKMSFEHLKNKD